MVLCYPEMSGPHSDSPLVNRKKVRRPLNGQEPPATQSSWEQTYPLYFFTYVCVFGRMCPCVCICMCAWHMETHG